MYQLIKLQVHPLLMRKIAATLFKWKVVLRCAGWLSELVTVRSEQQLDGRGRKLTLADDILVYRKGKHMYTCCETAKHLYGLSL
uniref:Uncharacterized protein n=1 Tax=Arion vulgaris TaxID=1028688 RepID=A0A0B7ANK2_9EUPU